MKCRIFNGRKVGDVAELLEGYPSIFIVADRNAGQYAEAVAASLAERGVRGPEASGHGTVADAVPTFLLDASEQNKTLETVMEICGWLLDRGADRNALVLAVGGGITTDMAGFAASIYKRGIRFAYIPTTFLAQVDAAIGGKTGVNFENFKNILGIIHQPEFTFICSEVLETLPYDDFVSGAAELLKTFIIDNGGDNYGKAVAVLSAIHESTDRREAIAGHLTELEELAGAAARIKAGVVERDEFEHGERRKLNLGHTFAHAIEREARQGEHGHDIRREAKALSGVHGKLSCTSVHNGISHGKAVAIGTIMAARVAEKFYAADANAIPSTRCRFSGKTRSSSLQSSMPDNGSDTEIPFADKLADDFRRCGLPTECPFPVGALSGAMQKDKKAENGIVHFILPRAIGDVRIENLPVSDVLSWIK